MSAGHQYVVGIDLGTTNSAVSFTDLESSDLSSGENRRKNIRSFKIPQLTGPGEVTRQSVLPSFLYLPGEYEISKEAIALPWPTPHDHVAGMFARDYGIKVPGRLVSSAKSWLCHGGVDRRAKILPWGSEESVGKVSPVQAAADYLAHIRQAWNHAHSDTPELALENQLVIVTVPASFDEVARDLTVEAARIAGLGKITLIEEPLAAFYSWLIRYEKEWKDHVTPGDLILVCDVGGGTTDFTLITLRETDGSPRFERLAVGDHLILGGDNMDLALARQIETQFDGKNISLTGDRYKMLCHQCRQAKEAILSGKQDAAVITLMGEGSRLIGGTLRAELTRADIEKTIVEGFFPLVSARPSKSPNNKRGIAEFGLPYESEPAITRHLGAFLDRHGEDVRAAVKKDNAAPDLILFNGGSLKSVLIQERIREALRYWFKVPDNRKPAVLDNPDQDLSVSLGAAYYGLVKSGVGVRVGSGSPRGYYLGISRTSSVKENKPEAICLVERGLDEGSDILLKEHGFQVLANQPVRFDVYSSSFRSGDHCGDILAVDETFTPLPPLHTVIEFGKKGSRTEIPVQVAARYTEMGTLSLWCNSETTRHRWQLQFQLRDSDAMTEVSDATILEDSVVSSVRETVGSAFSGKPDRQRMASLMKKISDILALKKEQWPLTLIRILADDLLQLPGNVLKHVDAEIRWMNLLGFTLRPGRGEGLDAHRVKNLWKRYKTGPANTNNPQVRSEWWILWRRVAGGLSPGHQRQISQDLVPVLSSGKGRKRKASPQETLEMWMLIANLEQLLAKDKVRWGRHMLGNIQHPGCKPQLLWSISRIGARELLYGSADRVISPDEAFAWCRHLMGIKWKAAKHALAAVTAMSRITGDRVRDMSHAQREEIISWMSSFKEADPYRKKLMEVVPMAPEEETSLFGESLPVGLVLHESEKESA